LLPLLTRPVFIHVVRDPREVADSLRRRDGMRPADALALWERYTREAFAASHGWKRLIVDYDALLRDPTDTTRVLFDALVDLGIEGLEMPSSDVIINWIEPKRPQESVEDFRLSDAQTTLLARINDRSILNSAGAQA
jgi:hypothetical protein